MLHQTCQDYLWELHTTLLLTAVGSLPLLLKHVVSPRQHHPEEYRLLLKLLHHASHLQVFLRTSLPCYGLGTKRWWQSDCHIADMLDRPSLAETDALISCSPTGRCGTAGM